MKKLLVLFILLFITISYTSFAQVTHCGTERWNVKTLTDIDTSKIDFIHVIKSTIHKQIMMKKPAKIKKNMARLSSESKVYEITANVVSFKKEDDKDYHVVISDPNTGENMVIEILDPECPGIKETSRYEELKKVRDWFSNEFNPTINFKSTSKKVKFSGVGFFDFLHGQNGMALNGREIHPVLKMEYVTE